MRFFHCLVGVPPTSAFGLKQVMPELKDLLATREHQREEESGGGSSFAREKHRCQAYVVAQ